MRSFELPCSSRSHGQTLCWGLSCHGAGVGYNRQVEYWQHAWYLGSWWDILEIKIGSFLVATPPQVCTIHKQLTLWWWVSDLMEFQEHRTVYVSD